MSTFAAMQAAQRWLVWRQESRPNASKPAKVPYYVDGYPRSGALDTSADAARLASFDAARAAVGTGKFTGLGFALGPDASGQHWQGIDFDDVAQNRLSDLANSLPGYVEFSPSGNGCHAIGLGRGFAALGSNRSGIEAYCAGRFFTFTGKPIRDLPVTCLAAYVEQRLAPRHKGKSLQPLSRPDRRDAVVSAEVLADLSAALRWICPDDYAEWVAIGHALVRLGEPGRRLWLDWSATSSKFDPHEDPAKWETFTGDSTGYAAVFAKAQAAGWLNPRSAMAQPLTQTQAGDEVRLLRVSVADLHTNPSPPPRFLIDALLPEREVTLLAADGGTGKSFLALIAAVCTAMGVDFFGRRTHAVRTLFLSAEDPAPILRNRLARICGAMQIDPSLLAERLCLVDSSEFPTLFTESYERDLGNFTTTTASFNDLQGLVREWGAGAVFIDNASDTFDANENVRVQVRAFMSALKGLARRNNAAVLLLAHLDKASVRGAGGRAKFSGSTAWHNSSRSRLSLERAEGGGLILAQEKTNHGLPAPAIRLRWGEDGMLIADSDPDGSTVATDALEVVLGLLREWNERGVSISTSLAANATTGAFAMLSDDQRFPRGLTRQKLASLLRTAQLQGRILAEGYVTPARHRAERWRVL